MSKIHDTLNSKELNRLDALKARIKARDEGRQAAKDGVVVGDNPYPENDETHWHWMDGWASEKIEQRKS